MLYDFRDSYLPSIKLHDEAQAVFDINIIMMINIQCIYDEKMINYVRINE